MMATLSKMLPLTRMEMFGACAILPGISKTTAPSRSIRAKFSVSSRVNFRAMSPISSDQLPEAPSETFWEPAPPPMQFQCFTQVELFLSRSQSAMDAVSRNHTHDRVSFFLEFYNQYKSQRDPLPVFFSRFAPRAPVDENRPTCIGRALKMRRILTQELIEMYPELDEKLYFVSGCYDPANPVRKLTRTELENEKFHLVHLGEHLVLALKFTVNDRLGYILFELSYLNFKPLVIMADNLPPSIGFIYVLDQTVRQYYVAKGPDYLSLSWKKTNPDGIQSYRETALYVGGQFNCPQYQAKLSTVYNVQYKYVIANGELQAHVKRLKNDKAFTVRRMKGKETIKTEVPLSYFIGNHKPIPELEEELQILAPLLRESYESLFSWMTRIALVQNDKKYLNELNEFVQHLQAVRRTELKVTPPQIES